MTTTWIIPDWLVNWWPIIVMIRRWTLVKNGFVSLCWFLLLVKTKKWKRNKRERGRERWKIRKWGAKGKREGKEKEDEKGEKIKWTEKIQEKRSVSSKRNISIYYMTMSVKWHLIIFWPFFSLIRFKCFSHSHSETTSKIELFLFTDLKFNT